MMIEIAGVKAVKHDTFIVDDTTGTLDHDDETDAELVWGWTANIEGFTSSQVREILIKFGITYLPFIDETGVNDVVDEFMENN